jgi:glycine/D-amino acid oxidase-like deaminating enzyme
MTDSLIIVGGGILGMTLAHRLAEDGRRRITVVERDLAGLGASVRSAGLHFPVGRTPVVREMTRHAQAHYHKRMGAIERMRPVPMRVHMREAAQEQFRPAFLPEANLTRRDDPGGLVDAGPGLVSWDAQGAHHTDVGAYVAHLQRTLPTGTRCLEACRVTEVRDTPGGAAVTLGDGRVLRADGAILAPGPWFGSPEFSQMTGELGLRVKRIVAFHIDIAPSETDAAEYFIEDDAFLLPLPWAGRWLFSYTVTEWDVCPEAVGPGLSAVHRRDAADVLARYVPAWADKLTAGRVFCDAYSTDYQPVIRTVGAFGNVLFAGGANGAGYRLAPAIAERAADLVAGMSTDEEEPVACNA